MSCLPSSFGIATVALFLLTGCNGDGMRDRGMETGSADPRQPIMEDAENNPAVVVQTTNQLTFQPSSVTIQTGQTVLWENLSQLTHTVTADESLAADPTNVRLPDDAQPFHSGRIEPGQSFEHRFTEPGMYRYVCLPHEEEGMIGTVIVEPAPEM